MRKFLFFLDLAVARPRAISRCSPPRARAARLRRSTAGDGPPRFSLPYAEMLYAATSRLDTDQTASSLPRSSRATAAVG